jgi:hypothetical protein
VGTLRTFFDQPLTKETIFDWHQMVMKGNARINTGQWRFHPEYMLVVSGAISKEAIHFEAPPSEIVHKEMVAFIRWFNNIAPRGSLEISNPSSVRPILLFTSRPFIRLKMEMEESVEPLRKKPCFNLWGILCFYAYHGQLHMT